MMRKLLLFLLFTGHISAQGQDADFTDLRNTRESFTRIYDKDIRRDLASFTLSGIGESINSQPLKKLPITKFGDNYIRFDSAGIQVIIQSGVFFAGKHKMGYEGKRLVKIDNKPYYGNYTKVPQVTISAVTVITGKDTIAIPPAAYGDLYNPRFTYLEGGVIKSQDAVYLSADKRNIYIYMLSRDDTGSYEVTWVIQDKKYLRRVVDFGFTH